MDEYPAGPASPGPWRLPLSVVIPVHNGGQDFERCLQGLRDSSRADFECVVVDDGSTDGSGPLAERFGARVIRHETPMGPAAARNVGALAASNPLIFFLDADVAVHPDTIARALRRFEADGQLSGLFGSYDDRPAAPGWVSQFRNLLHHFVHQDGAFEGDVRPARTFWTGCGFIKRDVFMALGGFDPLRYRRPAIEDIELGYRISRGGHKLVLARDVQATHLKRWTLFDMIRTDIFRRGVPWMLLMKRSSVAETDLNVSRSQQACVAATGLGGLGLLASARWPVMLLVPLGAMVAVVALNFPFYRFLARIKGGMFAVTSVLLHLVYYASCGISVVIALGIWHLAPRQGFADAGTLGGASPRPRRRPVARRDPRPSPRLRAGPPFGSASGTACGREEGMTASRVGLGKSSNTMGVLVIGLGDMGAQRAAATVALTRRLRLVALFDRDQALAERLAAKYGVVAVPDLVTGLDSRGVDVALIATPSGDHASAVSRALSAGKHVLCEAPLVIRSRDGRILAKRASEVQLKLATGFFRRFDPPILDALALVESWAIGRVESVRVEVGHRASLNFLQSWRTEVARSGGGALMHHGPAACDLIRRLLGEVVVAKGFVREDVRMPPGCESEAFGLYRNHDNAFAELHASWNLPEPGLHLEIRGESGSLKLKTNPWRLSGRLSSGRRVDRRYRSARVAERIHRVRFGCGRSIVAELNAFEGASFGSTSPHASGWDGYRVTEMIQAIYQSNRTGDEVHLNPSLVQVPCVAGH